MAALAIPSIYFSFPPYLPQLGIKKSHLQTLCCDVRNAEKTSLFSKLTLISSFFFLISNSPLTGTKFLM